MRDNVGYNIPWHSGYLFNTAEASEILVLGGGGEGS
jgi:hypothetical protein